MATVKYCRFKYARAPLRIAKEIAAIALVPSENRITLCARNDANSKATIELIGAKNIRSVRVTPF